MSTTNPSPTARLLTGRFHGFDASMGVAVAISLGKPKWPLPYEIAAEVDALKPFGLLQLAGDEFDEAYRRRLDHIGVDTIRAALAEIAAEHGGPLVLLCWERPGEHCHRRTWAAWWEDRTGETVPEVGR